MFEAFCFESSLRTDGTAEINGGRRDNHHMCCVLARPSHRRGDEHAHARAGTAPDAFEERQVRSTYEDTP